MKRIIIHWTAGRYYPTEFEKNYWSQDSSFNCRHYVKYDAFVFIPVKDSNAEAITLTCDFDDVEDKWVVCPENMTLSKKEIAEKTDFQEKYFKTEIMV